MLAHLLPRQVDNHFPGHWLGLWLFGALILTKGAIGLGTMLNGRQAAIEADGIPLQGFSTAGEQAFVALFAAWGLAQLVLNLFGFLVLLRYRALVPLMYTVLLTEHLARRGLFQILPMPREGAPPGYWINLALLAIMLAGLALSLSRARAPQPQA